MLESALHLRKRNYSTCIKKTKEEQEKDLFGIPKNIGPYQLIEKLKDGGYSRIYKAKSNYTGDFVSIKSIEKMSFQESVEDVLLMVRQAEVLKILKHRNIVNLYEIYESPKYFFMIMDYLPNGDLIEQIIKKKRFQEKEALVIFSQLVDALYYMHKNEICHRDIRTEKILFDKKNKPKFVGFSYSTFYTQGKKIKDSYGSLCYACPEIIQNDYYNPELADVWSLGVVLYVMVCGYLPFSEDDDEENKYLIINGKVDYPTQISNKVKDLLKHMLDINPNKRYTFQKIIKHPWFKPFDEATLTGGINSFKMIYPVDERILKIIVIYGFNKKEVDKDLKQNIFNCQTGLYKQLNDKLLYMGFTSFSDLCSDDFMKFCKDKENIITDGEKKYKKYINKILEKIKKVERYVNDYKRKEDKIIKDLENIYNDAVEEEMKNKKMLRNNAKIKENNYIHLKKENDMNARNNIKTNTSKMKRKTVSPFESVKEQKLIKNIYRLKENKNDKEIDEDFDVLKAFNEGNKLNINKKENSNLSMEENDFEINNFKIKKTKSNPNIKDFVQKLIEKDDKSRDLFELDSELYEENLNVIRNSKRKRQLSVMIRKKKRNYLNTKNENNYFLKKPKDSSQRKKIIEDNYKKSIKNIIIEENINEEKDKEEQNNEYEVNNNCKDFEFYQEIEQKNDIDTNNKKEIKLKENKKKKSLRFSLSFADDEDDEEEEVEENEDMSISRIESKRVSMYDIDEEIKELKEIKNNIKSPLRSSFLKRNTNDNNLINFNMESNSSIFGEHLEENVSRKNSNAFLLESVNEKYDLLTELKRLSEKANGKKKKSKNEGKLKFNENKEINEFNNDSFGDINSEKEKEKIFNNKEYKNNTNIYDNNLIVFDDKLEISFHEEKNDNIKERKDMNNTNTNTNNNHLELKNIRNGKDREEICEIKKFYLDNKKISKLNIFDKYEDISCSIANINSKKENQYKFIFNKDKWFIKKINLINFEDNIINWNININKTHTKEYSNGFTHKSLLKNKKESSNNYAKLNSGIGICKIKNKKSKEKKQNIKDIKEKNDLFHSSSNIPNKTNTSNSNNKYNINSLLNDKNNKIINFYNHNDNLSQKVYIFDNSKNIQNLSSTGRKTINNQNINNNIIINTNNNTINNISFLNKNIFQQYYKQKHIINENYNKNEEKNTKKTNINYSKYINEIKISNNKINLIKGIKSKNNYSFKSRTKKPLKNLSSNKNIKLYLNNAERLKSSIKGSNNSKKASNELTISNKTSYNENIRIKTIDDKKKGEASDDTFKFERTLLLPINLVYKFNKEMNSFKEKNKKTSISIEKLFHHSIINDGDEILDNPGVIISKLKKGQKIKKLLSKDKTNLKKSNKYYKKFINKGWTNNTIKNSNYSILYYKKLNLNKNNYNRNNYDFDDEIRNKEKNT